MPTLYVAPGACSFGAHVALKEAGIPHRIVVVKLRVPDSPIHQVNPLGRVPALVSDDGVVITENSAILPYIADLAPDSGLIAPAGSEARAKIQEWIGFLNSEVHGAFRSINRPALFSPDEAAHEAIRASGRKRLLDAYATLESRLAGKTWAVEERFSVADAYLGVFVGWAARAGIDLQAFPALRDFLERYTARPSVRAAREEETRAHEPAAA